MTKNKSYQDFIQLQGDLNKSKEKTGPKKDLLDRNNKIISLIEGLPLTKETAILDVGAGSGNVSKALKERGFQNISLLDFLDQRDETAKYFPFHQIDLVDIDADELEKEMKEKYELIILGDVLEHFTQPYVVLNKLKRLMKKGSYVIVSVPNSGFVFNGVLLTFFPSKMFFSTAFGPWGHYYHFTFYELDKILSVLKFQKKVLKGGLIDDHVYTSIGLKGFLFKTLRYLLFPLSISIPSVFSDHIYAAYENTDESPLSEKFIYENFVV